MPIQYDLHKLQFYTDKVDGDFGKHSTEAVRNFALAHNLDPDIRPTDPDFLRALARAVVDFDQSNQ